MALQNFVEAIYFGKIKIKYIKIKGIRMVGTAEKTRAPYTLRLPHEWWPLAVARALTVPLPADRYPRWEYITVIMNSSQFN